MGLLPSRGFSGVRGGGPRSAGFHGATSSWISGRKPGLDLQREVVKGVFIHDQSLIQKVLGHLGGDDGKAKKERKERKSLFNNLLISSTFVSFKTTLQALKTIQKFERGMMDTSHPQ